MSAQFQAQFIHLKLLGNILGKSCFDLACQQTFVAGNELDLQLATGIVPSAMEFSAHPSGKLKQEGPIYRFDRRGERI